ncbi:hypothetical protein Hypma_000619 [Hypsizygus marmoreus]|uniref:Uncharacterized protein n=1 Tax=Hypsizygus marmoreus TaxID=39966 RepID=A0A369JCI0_HYPMA|nr:hypothetical protein Hypma_000619 [Hypsizygus marmoreus]
MYPPQPPAATLTINGVSCNPSAFRTFKNYDGFRFGLGLLNVPFLKPKPNENPVKPHTIGRQFKAHQQTSNRFMVLRPRKETERYWVHKQPIDSLDGVSLLLYGSRSVSNHYFLYNMLTYNTERIILLTSDYRGDVPLGKSQLHYAPLILWLIVVAHNLLASSMGASRETFEPRFVSILFAFTTPQETFHKARAHQYDAAARRPLWSPTEFGSEKRRNQHPRIPAPWKQNDRPSKSTAASQRSMRRCQSVGMRSSSFGKIAMGAPYLSLGRYGITDVQYVAVGIGANHAPGKGPPRHAEDWMDGDEGCIIEHELMDEYFSDGGVSAD